MQFRNMSIFRSVIDKLLNKRILYIYTALSTIESFRFDLTNQELNNSV